MAFIDSSTYTDHGVWNIWCDATNATTTTDTWSNWCNVNATTTTTVITPAETIWVNWVVNASGNRRIVQRAPTAEEIAAAERRDAEARERGRVQAEQYRAAKERAEGFLYAHLTDAQRAQLKRDKFFVVRGGHSKKQYRIAANGDTYHGNVTELDALGREIKRYCAALDYAANAPSYDHYLAQKLMLEHCEQDFIRIANGTNLPV